MAFPTILVNSATGSDATAVSAGVSPCSGAGPSTPKVDSANAYTDGTGGSTTTAVYIASTQDLSGVDTTGLAVLYIDDTTAGNRRYARITGVSGSSGAWTVTVASAYASLNAKNWGIGGKLASIGAAKSLLLVDNNGAVGDAMPGWIIEMESGHTETLTSTYNIRRSGDATSGPITLRGALNAATPPVLTWTNNGYGFLLVNNVAYFTIAALDLENSNVTKGASSNAVRFSGSAADGIVQNRLRIKSQANYWYDGIVGASNGGEGIIRDCEVAYCSNRGMFIASTQSTIINNYIHDNTGIGVSIAGGSATCIVDGNIIVRNGGGGIAGANSAFLCWIINNTIHGNTGAGVYINHATASQGMIKNNSITYNTGYGLQFHASLTVEAVRAGTLRVLGNGHYSNSSGWMNLSVDEEDTTNADPSSGGTSAANDYANVAGGSNFAVGTNFKAKGYPVLGTTKVGYFSTSDSYVDIGAAQRQESAGGGAAGRRNMRGGFIN